MAINCLKIDYFEKKFWGDREINVLKNILEQLGGFICYATSLHPLSIPSIPRQKYVKNINIKRDRSPLKFHICIEMIGKCKFKMALNCFEIDFFEILGGI